MFPICPYRSRVLFQRQKKNFSLPVGLALSCSRSDTVIFRLLILFFYFHLFSYSVSLEPSVWGIRIWTRTIAVSSRSSEPGSSLKSASLSIPFSFAHDSEKQNPLDLILSFVPFRFTLLIHSFIYNSAIFRHPKSTNSNSFLSLDFLFLPCLCFT